MPTPEQRRDILNRLKSVDGHLRGVIKMVDEDAYCMDVIKQLQAVQGAIGRVNALLLSDHLQTCVTTAIRGDVPSERERVIGELLRLSISQTHEAKTLAIVLLLFLTIIGVDQLSAWLRRKLVGEQAFAFGRGD